MQGMNANYAQQYLDGPISYSQNSGGILGGGD
jgi:hypothetical protein